MFTYKDNKENKENIKISDKQKNAGSIKIVRLFPFGKEFNGNYNYFKSKMNNACLSNYFSIDPETGNFKLDTQGTKLKAIVEENSIKGEALQRYKLFWGDRLLCETRIKNCAIYAISLSILASDGFLSYIPECLLDKNVTSQLAPLIYNPNLPLRDQLEIIYKEYNGYYEPLLENGQKVYLSRQYFRPIQLSDQIFYLSYYGKKVESSKMDEVYEISTSSEDRAAQLVENGQQVIKRLQNIAHGKNDICEPGDLDDYIKNFHREDNLQHSKQLPDDTMEFSANIILTILTGRVYCSIEDYQALCGFMLQKDFSHSYGLSFQFDLLRPWILEQHPGLLEGASNESIIEKLKLGLLDNKLPVKRLSSETIRALDEMTSKLSNAEILSTEKIESLSRNLLNSSKSARFIMR